MSEAIFNPQVCHDHLYNTAPKALAFANQTDLPAWQNQLRRKLQELVGIMPEPTELNVRVDFTEEHEQFFERRFVFQSEELCHVPCHLLIPKTGTGPYPLVICLQGHTTGMHISLGRTCYSGDQRYLGGDRDFAMQAVNQGYAALTLEQRCFGERRDAQPEHVHRCQQGTMGALLLGRTMVGERVWDIKRAIDAVEAFPEVDHDRIACMGNSGGGTVTYYAACLEPRIRIAMPSCSVCTYKDSIGRIYHCTDNYIPGVYQYFEMGDLAGCIAPRPLVVVAGREDEIFPIGGVEENFAIIQQIYEAAGVPASCRLVVGDGGHRFYAEQGWEAFRELAGW